MTREEIITSNPIVDFVRSGGHELKPAGQNFVTNACPQTQHKRGHRPVMIYPETQSWSCHDCKRGGSVIDWVMMKKNVTAVEAMRELAGKLNGSEPAARFVKTSRGQLGKTPAANQNVTFDWSQNCVAPLTPKELIRLGNERWYSRQFCTWLHDKKYVGLVHGDFAFPVQDDGNILAAHYRVKAKQVGEKDDWFYFPTGIGARPFVIGDLSKAKQIHIGESQWDMLALADRADLYLNQNHAFIATRGAGNAALCNDLIPEGVSVLAWPQNDEAGNRWLDELSTKVPVQVARAVVPEQFKDVNEWTRAGATADDLLAALLNAEVIHKAEKSRPLHVEPPNAPWGFEQWQAVILANFPAYARPSEICASVVVQLLLNDVSNPFALALVDVPSSGKTITLNFFDVPDLAYTTDNFTPASFVSHASNVKREELANVDMLPRIRYRTLVVRDLAPIFGVKEDELLKTIGILIRALDGEGLETDSGVHGKRGYKGDWLFMLLAGTTPIPPRVFKVMGTLGSRLFFLALRSNAKSHDELIAQNRGTARREKERTCREATDSLLRTLWTEHPSGVNWGKDGDPEDCLRVIARCAELLAALRGTILIWQSEHDGTVSHSVPVIEQPDRINCLLYNLARGHALLCGRTQLATADLAPVLEVTFDSAPTIRSKVFRTLLEQNGTLKTGQVEKLLRCSKPTALKEMEALAVLGIADKTEGDPEYGRPEHELRLAEKFQWFTTDKCKGLRWP